MNRSLTLTLLLSSAVGLTLFIGCGDQGIGDSGGTGTNGSGTDTATTGNTTPAEVCDDGVDNDGDDAVDCDDSDCDGDSACTFFEPTMLLMSVQTGVMDGAQHDVTLDGSPLGNYFVITLVNKEWSGLKDTRNYCEIMFDTTGADVATGCTDCWADTAWTVDTTNLVGTDGECDSMDPNVWSDDVASYLAGNSYAYGFGPMSADFGSTILKSSKDFWNQYSSNLFSTYIMTDLTGTTDWYELDYTFAYEYDATTGELKVDSSGNQIMVDVTGLPAAPDGYYLGNFYYGFSFTN
ncbi:MAG: hypothetical protein GXP62_03615 [Oligoflexia bacterium]|nr:hypothetical protein [Oligoflexia bacterium]